MKTLIAANGPVVPVNLVVTSSFVTLNYLMCPGRQSTLMVLLVLISSGLSIWLVDCLVKGPFISLLGDQLLHGGMAGCLSGTGLAD